MNRRTLFGLIPTALAARRITSPASTPLGQNGIAKTIGLADPVNTPIIWKKFGGEWVPTEGMQRAAMSWSDPGSIYPIDEMLCTGVRGSGHTSLCAFWLSRLVLIPDYVGTILVPGSTEGLREATETAWQIYRRMGAVKYGYPTSFKFPSGARIYTGVLRDAASYDQYRGHKYQRIAIDNAQQIEEEHQYASILSSNRTSAPDILPQVLLTAIPDGRGRDWIRNRFFYDCNGNSLLRSTKAGSLATVPYSDPLTRRRRVVIRGSVNPHLLAADPLYLDRCGDPSHPLERRNAWLRGDWDYDGKLHSRLSATSE